MITESPTVHEMHTDANARVAGMLDELSLEWEQFYAGELPPTEAEIEEMYQAHRRHQAAQFMAGFDHAVALLKAS